MKEKIKELEKPGCVNCKPACCEDVTLILTEDEFDIVFYGRHDSEENPIDREHEVQITKLVAREKKLRRRAGCKPSYEYDEDLGRRRDTREHVQIGGQCGNVIPVVDQRTGSTFLGCRFHNQPEQPLVCSKGFPEGGYGCLKFRAERLRSKE